MGRPRFDPARQKKKSRAVSLTDDEWQQLNDNAAAAGQGPSEYVLARCCTRATANEKAPTT